MVQNHSVVIDQNMKIVGERMVELALQAWKGDYDEIIKLAKAMDIPVEYNGKVLHLGGRGEYPNYSNVPTAIYKGLDPMTIFACLGLAFYGMFWTQIMGDATELLNKRWREEMKKERGQKKTNENKETLEAWVKNFLKED